MRKVIVIILLFLFSSTPSYAVSISEVKAFEFLKGKREEFLCQKFLETYPHSPFKKTVFEILISILDDNKNYYELSRLNFKDTKVNDFFLLKYAKALKKVGKVEEAKRIYFDIFRRSNRYDEEIVVQNAGDTKFLFGNRVVLRKKIGYALSRRNFEIASFYINLLPMNNRYYTYLKGVLEYKRRNRKAARFYFKRSDIPERLFFLTLMEKDSFKKVQLLEQFLNTDGRRSFKVLASRIVLNWFLVSNIPLYKKTLNVVKGFDLDIYNEYLVKYYVNLGKFDKGIVVLEKMGTPDSRGLILALKKYLGRKITSKDVTRISPFYRFYLGYGKPVLFEEPNISMIKDEGLRYIVKNRKKYLLDFIDIKRFDKFDLAVGFYLCGKYREAIRFAALVAGKARKYAVINRILYPSPGIFNRDVVALSVAKQESLFDPGAFSRSGAIGYMQIMPLTGKHISSIFKDDFVVANLYDEKVNVTYGEFYIKKLIKRFDSFPLAAAAYNAGPGRIKRLLKIYGKPKTAVETVLFVDTFLPLDETRNYVKKVVKNCFYYSYLFNESLRMCTTK